MVSTVITVEMFMMFPAQTSPDVQTFPRHPGPPPPWRRSCEWNRIVTSVGPPKTWDWSGEEWRIQTLIYILIYIIGDIVIIVTIISFYIYIYHIRSYKPTTNRVVSNIWIIFHNIWDNPSHWRTPSFFKMVKTTNQLKKRLFFLDHINQQPIGDIVINNYIVYGYI